MRHDALCAQVQAVIVMPALNKRAAAKKGKQNAKKQKPAKEGVPDCGRLPRAPAKPLRCNASQRIRDCDLTLERVLEHLI